MATPATKLPPPPAQKPPPSVSAQEEASREFPVTSGKIDAPQKIVLYGAGGIGKSTLAALESSSGSAGSRHPRHRLGHQG